MFCFSFFEDKISVKRDFKSRTFELAARKSALVVESAVSISAGNLFATLGVDVIVEGIVT